MNTDHYDPGRFWVRLISARVLADSMEYRGENVRSLAFKVGVSRATIGHLRSGARNTCKPATAKKIAKVLGVAPSSLFEPEVSRVSGNTSRVA